ncbi:MAG: NAD-dependent deacylase [Acidobacteria bacterium]|nr:NAD-dependent deacylase [Acidobacteriota bacterium]
MADDVVSQVAGWVAEAQRIVALTGAGISTESGIPDFRGPNGIWTKNPGAELRATIETWLSDRDFRVESWRRRIDDPPYRGDPNAGHLALGELDRQGRILLVVTQNVDGLHQRGGVDPTRVVEVHGSVREFMCMGCGARGPMGDVLDRVRAGDDDPACLSCGGILKSATVSFGQSLFPGDMDRAELASVQADLFLAIGSTLQVYPAAGIVPIAKRAGARLVIVNDSETPFDPIADAVLRGRIGELLPALVPDPISES